MARLTTQSYTKIILIVLLGLLLFGIAGFGSCSRGWPWEWGRASALSEIGNAEIDAQTVKNIKINWASGSVDVMVKETGDTLTLKETVTGTLTKAQEMRWQVVGNTLKIDYGTWFSCMSLGDKRLEIVIPKSCAQGLGLVDIDGASGMYTLTDVSCQNFKVSLASGSLNAQNMTIGDLKLSTASGYASVGGNIKGNIKLDTASGEVNVVSNKAVPQSIDADMASGTVTVSIPENEGFTAKVNKLSGGFDSDFSTQGQDSKYIYKNGAMSIKADMASGHFVLKKSA